MKYLRSEVVKTIKSWKGKKESDGSHEEIIDIYNAQRNLPRGYKVKYSDPWCAVTVSAVSLTLGYSKIIPIECSCAKMIGHAKIMGIWIENDNYNPSVGDIVLYDWQDNGKGDNVGNPDHIGIITEVSKDCFIVTEGNLNNSVADRVLQKNARYIRGFIAPRYESEVANTSKPSETSPAIELLAKEVIAGKWGNGSERYERIERATQETVNKMLKG